MDNQIYIFQLPTLCNYGINCTDRNCNYSHPLGFYKQKHPKYKYYIGKQNILFKCYKIMTKKFKNQITLQYFTNKFNNFNFEQILGIKYFGMDYNMLPQPYFLLENSLVLNHGANHLGGGVLRKGFVQEEIKTLSSTLLGAFVACHDWKNLPIELQSSLIKEPFVIRMEQFANIEKLYATDGVLKANNIQTVEQNIEALDNIIKFDWLCMAFPKLEFTDGRQYNYDMLLQMFITSYRAFSIGLANAICNADDEINIQIGNIGCGAFNHCINVTFSIVMLGLYSARLEINKKINIYYCAYDDNNCKELNGDNGAVNFLKSCEGNNIGQIISDVMDKCKKYKNWRDKL
jgi:hypothetical protein